MSLCKQGQFKEKMTDLVSQLIWLVGTLAVFALISIGGYAITKIGTLIVRRSVEVDPIFLFGGALVAMFFLPSSDHATVESRLMLAAALVVGGFLGGVVGLVVHLYLSRDPLLKSAARLEGEVVSGDHRSIKGISALARFFFFLLLLVCGAIVVAVRLGDLPIVNPLITFFAQLLT